MLVLSIFYIPTAFLLAGSLVDSVRAYGERQLNPNTLTTQMEENYRKHQEPRFGRIGFPFSTDEEEILALLLELILLTLLFVALGSKEHGNVEWDLEWLVTFPLSEKALLLTRILERGLSNFLAIILFLPLFTMIFRERLDSFWLGLGFGALVTPFMLMVLEALHLLAETWLRMRISHARRRNIQATCSLLGYGSLFLMYLGFVGPRKLLEDTPLPATLSYKPSWMDWFPFEQLIKGISSETGEEQILGMGVFIGLTAVISILCLARTIWLIRDGVVEGGFRETSRQKKKAGSLLGKTSDRKLFTAVQAKEFLLLVRDRNYLFQTLVVPLMFTAFQVGVNPSLTKAVSGSFTIVAVMAFSLGGYILSGAAQRILQSEGQSLWFTFSQPISLEKFVTQKVILWGAFVALYVAGFLGYGWWRCWPLSPEDISRAVMALTGIPLFAIISGCFGVFIADPFAQEVHQGTRSGFMFLLLLLISFYSYTIYDDDFFRRLTLFVLTALLCFALVQKVRDHAPYLLDRTARPPARVSLADGVIAAQAFFVAEGLVALMLGWGLGLPISTAVTLGYSFGGMLVFGAAYAAFSTWEYEGIPQFVSYSPKKDRMGSGVLTGMAVAGCALAYLWAVRYYGWFADFFASDEKLLGAGEILFLGVVCAPIVEEFIFRGLVFGGLKRSVKTWQAVVLSASIFALVHPPVSVLPVFLLGVGTALLYHQTGALLAPILAHGVYNLLVVGYQFYF